MKKTVLLLACLLGVSSAAHAQTISFEINAGLLENAAGTTPEQNGGLLQLIASPSGTFAAPTSASYVSGDNVLLASFAMNSNGGASGYTSNDFTNFALQTSSYTLAAGEAVLLRFYPGLTLAAQPAAPASGTFYGQVRSSTAETGISDTSQTAWVVPSAGSTVDFDYVTIKAGQGGTYPDGANGSGISSFATFTVVPEPSAGVMSGFGILGLAGLQVWSRRRATRAL